MEPPSSPPIINSDDDLEIWEIAVIAGTGAVAILMCCYACYLSWAMRRRGRIGQTDPISISVTAPKNKILETTGNPGKPPADNRWKPISGNPGKYPTSNPKPFTGNPGKPSVNPGKPPAGTPGKPSVNPGKPSVNPGKPSVNPITTVNSTRKPLKA